MSHRVRPSANVRLLTALLDGTKEGTITWREASGHGDAFIARRQSGTVTIRYRGMADVVNAINLVVRDASGADIVQIAAPPGGAMVDKLTGGYPRETQLLTELYAAILESEVQRDRAIEQLIDEFKGS